MPLPRVLVLALVAFAFAAPLIAASGLPPPPGATTVDVGTRVAHHWVANATQEPNAIVSEAFRPGDNASLRVAGLMDQQGENATAIVWEIAATSGTLVFTPPNATLRKEYGNITTSEAHHFGMLNFTAPAEIGNYTYSVTFTTFAEENGTMRQLATATSQGTVVVASAEVPAPPTAIPTPWLIAGAAVLAIGGGAAAVALRQRAVRRRMNEGPRRSQVMRDLELEQKLEKARTKDPEAAVVIQQEIRQAEQVREKRREIQILEAKRADAIKTMDLLRKRHEAGGLTKLQYDNMVAKKQADLDRIDAEIAEMERQDRGAAA